VIRSAITPAQSANLGKIFGGTTIAMFKKIRYSFLAAGFLGNAMAAAQTIEGQKSAERTMYHDFTSRSYILLAHRGSFVRESNGHNLGNPVRMRFEGKADIFFRRATEIYFLGGLERSPDSEEIRQFRSEVGVIHKFWEQGSTYAGPFLKGKLPYQADGTSGVIGAVVGSGVVLPAPLGQLKLSGSIAEAGSWSSRRSKAVVTNGTGESAEAFGLLDNPDDTVGGTDLNKGQSISSEFNGSASFTPAIVQRLTGEAAIKGIAIHSPKYELNSNGKVYRTYSRSSSIQNTIRGVYAVSQAHRVAAEVTFNYNGAYSNPQFASKRSGTPYVTTMLGIYSDL
jgi:hypothetical protein